ncbi:MAG TPA: glycosyltransferase [Longimicrobiales bacterium]|nr:glycosyltransferase [Longimicrobiales bacterium]
MQDQASPQVPAAGLAPDAVLQSVTPRVAEWKENAIRAVAVVALLYATYWVTWRWTNTINTDGWAVVPSLLLLLAETYAYLNICLFVFMVWRLREREPGPAPLGRTVDVFITCYDEPLEVLRRTAMGAREIQYPHRTYFLDDGKRDEVRELAETLGIGYIRRVGNANAKSGNLNYALSVTSGEFILQLDADHVPLPSIVHRMLGYFNDARVAIVQSPQDFYNVDSFSHIVNDEGRRLWEENRIFYSLIQPGRDHWDASFFCGSGGILRRAALAEIGGFASKTIIEDMETTMELNARGWKSVYHNETLAYGLAPGNAAAYHVQRLRWGQGAMQVLRKMKPLTMRGLSLPQRINYFAGTATYFEGWQKLIFYLMPLLFFYTGVLPVAVNERDFLIRLVPYITLAILTFELLSRGTGYLLLSERFTMVRFFTYVVAALSVFSSKPLKFNVTPKGKTGVPFRTYAPQLALFVLSLCAPIFATVAYYRGWVAYDARGWGSAAFWVNSVWVLWNCYFAGYVVRHCLAMKTQRDDHRFAEHMPIQVRTTAGLVVAALTADLNPTGLGFRATQRLEPGTAVSMWLPLATGLVPVTGEVRHVGERPSGTGHVYTHGVAFGELPIEARDAIELHCTQHAMPAWRQRYRQSIDIVTRVTEVMRSMRRDRRRLVRLPARVQRLDGGAATDTELLILEEISARGAKVVGQAPIVPGTQIRFDVPGTGISEVGVVRYVNAVETWMAVQFEMGIELVFPNLKQVPAAPARAQITAPANADVPG